MGSPKEGEGPLRTVQRIWFDTREKDNAEPHDKEWIFESERAENGQNFVPNGTKIVGRMNQKRPFKGYFIPNYPKNGTSVTFFIWHHIYFATRAILCNFAT